jgi:membrane protease YdiL (CAAX protease family)
MDIRRSIVLELAAIGVLALAFVVMFPARPSYVDFALAIVAVGLIVSSRPRSERIWRGVSMAAAGDRPARRAFIETGVFTGIALAALAAAAASTAAPGTLIDRLVDWHMLLAAGLYLPWAFAQQYVFQFYLLGRLARVLPLLLAVAVTAAAFASVHFPRWPVMALTALAGAFWSFTYYRFRRLTPLAVSHALLGSALHYWVFGRDLLDAWLP